MMSASLKESNNIYSQSAYIDSTKLNFEEEADDDLSDRSATPKAIPATKLGNLKSKKVDIDLKYVTRKPKNQLKKEPSREEMKNQSELPVRLIPIKLDLEVDGVKLNDSFTWNINETLTTPEEFAQTFASDIDSIVAPAFVPMIAKAIREQCSVFGDSVFISDDEHIRVNDQSSKKIDILHQKSELINENSDDTLAQNEYIKHEEFLIDNDESQLRQLQEQSSARIVINLDLNVESIILRDSFEWPLFASSVTPEEFAKNLAADVGLGGSFVPIIAASIREQVCVARLNYDSTNTITGLEGRPLRMGLSSLTVDEDNESISEWEPHLKKVSGGELDKLSKEKERQIRRLRRSQKTRYDIGFEYSPFQTSSPPPKIPYRNYVPTAEEQEIFSQLGVVSDFPQVAPAALSDSNLFYHPHHYPGPFNHHLHALNNTMGPGGIPEYSSHLISSGIHHHIYHHSPPTISPHLMHSTPPPSALNSSASSSSNIYSSMSGQSLYPSSSILANQYHPFQIRNNGGQYHYGIPDEHRMTSTTSKRGPGAPKKSAKPPVVDPELVKRQIELMKRTINGHQSDEDDEKPCSKRKWLGSGGSESVSPIKKHRGFGASAVPFNYDGSVDVGEFRQKWRCGWCCLSGAFTPTLRKGPLGSKTLCNACGIWYSKHGSLPEDRYHEHAEK
ncbi:Snf5- protein 1 [Nowakowskiella sp. JEL0407]|nr:Snf5- protein 1 [Nowakowskiella sp. JEL0407]